jgi:hypothetical protein
MTSALAIATYGERHRNAPSQLDVFAFLIGKWDGVGKTTTPEGKVVEFAVTWIGRYILDGMAIADEFHSKAPDGSPYLGISFRQYDAAKKTWVVECLNISNSFLRRQVNARSGSVQVDGQAVVVTSQSPEMWSRETYRVPSLDRFTYTIDLSSDAGRSWALGQIEIMFTRKE